MEFIGMIAFPGIVGGLLLAGALMIVHRRARRRTVAAPSELAPMTPDLINMAHIKVAGVGGLGLVATAVATAFALPEAGVSLAIGLAGGILLATVLVLWRSHAAS